MTNNFYAALKLGDFRLLMVARVLVTVNMQILSLAVGWQIYALTKDPLFLGFLGLAEAVPAICIALYAGHIADTIDRRLLALGAVFLYVGSFALLAICSATIVSKDLLVLAIYFAMALIGFGRGFYGPAVFGLFSDIVPRELYGNAIAWNTMQWQVSAITGTVLGGVLYTWLSAASTYFISAILLSIAFCFFLLIKSRTIVDSNEQPGALENIKAGLRFICSNEIVFGAMTLDVFAVLFGGAVALLPIYTAEVFHLGPQALGLLRAAPRVGALLACGVLARRPVADNAGVVLLTVVAGFGLCMIGFAVSTSFYLSMFLLALSGAFDGISFWLRSMILQLIAPKDMKGRVSAVNQILLVSSNEIGGFESGFAARIMGLVPSVIFGGCMTLAVAVTTWLKAPKLRRLHMHHLDQVKESP